MNKLIKRDNPRLPGPAGNAIQLPAAHRAGARARRAVALLIFLLGGLILLAPMFARYSEQRAADAPAPLTTPAVSDYVLLQDGRIALEEDLYRLRSEQERIDVAIERMNSEWLQAVGERREEIALASQRLDVTRQALGLEIERTQADIDAGRERAAADATAAAQGYAVIAEATRQAIVNIEREAAAQSAATRARVFDLAYWLLLVGFTAVLSVGAYGVVVYTRMLIIAHLRQRAASAAASDLAEELFGGVNVNPGPPPAGRPVREPTRAGQNRSRTTGSTRENRSRTVPENRSEEPGTVLEEPAETLDATRPPTAGERAIIRRWYNQLHSLSAVCRTLYGYKNGVTMGYVKDAVEEGERDGGQT